MIIVIPYIIIAFFWMALFSSICKRFKVEVPSYRNSGNNVLLGFLIYFVCVVGAALSLVWFHRAYSILLSQNVLGAIYGVFIVAFLLLAAISLFIAGIQKLYRLFSKTKSEMDE